ncbi:MAG: T9SS type A sorting domain-containing protein, partial [Ferruginibacter sp.]|nr:T9SS type A sorting domain-containing protein [Ferruginibacter sp.]
DNKLPNATVVYYRLKMIDADGKFKNSNIIAVKLNKNFSNALVYPNPTIGELNIQLYKPLFTNSTLQVLDVTGRMIKQQNISANNLNIKLDVENLSAGRYFIKITNNRQVINESFVVIK